MESPRKQTPVLPLSIILAALVITILTFLLPVVSKAVNPLATHWRTAAGTATMVLYVGAATTFLSGLKSFKTELKVAYRLIAYGILAFSAALIQLVIWGMFDLWDSAWATSGSGLVPYLLTGGLIYLGARKFARLLGVHSILTSFWFTFVITLLTGIALGIAAHYLVQYHIDGTDLYIGVASWASGYLLIAAVLVYKIFRSIGAYYHTAMRWLTIGLFGLAASGWHEALNTFFFNNGDTYTDYGYYLIPWVVSGVLLVRASYQFRLLPVVTNAGDTPKAVAEASDRDYIDSIVSVAGLVSRPQEVDDILDELRLVTSGLHDGRTLTPSDKQRLVKTYRQLEAYLGAKDPLHTFTKEEVLGQVTPAFRGLVAST